ncbi:MAG: phosphomannomutase/phosphoglucomutase [Deltaproteobacteria bacterium]|nr:phosphomannomutase/phosphoglucomutase [Deltaproteobacteria bacterium]
MPSFDVPPQIFREYDIRGVADQHLSSDLFRALGRAFSTLFPRAGEAGARRVKVAVGRDCRLSSPRLHEALIDGLTAGGLDVVDIGVGPTPQLYFAVHHLEVDGGLMITGSHNPAPENGIKMLRRTGSIYGEEIQALRRRIEADDVPVAKVRGDLGHYDVVPAYVEHVAKDVRVDDKSFPVVVDAGNGAGGPLAMATLKALGLTPVPLYCEMDGRFPNHHPDPTQPENVAELIATVKKSGARVGLAFDGDADRLGAIDADGSIVWGDRLLTLFARDILRDRPGGAILGEVKCSQTLYDDIARHGGRPILWKTGHSLIKAKMKEEKALLAGEMSGHLFFADRYFGFDDAIYAACRLIEILAREGKSIGELLADLPPTFVTPEIRVDCPDATKFALVDRVKKHFQERARVGAEVAGMKVREVIDVDGARVIFDHGWGLVRASNTQPVLVVRFEADTEARRDAIHAAVQNAIDEMRAGLPG